MFAWTLPQMPNQNTKRLYPRNLWRTWQRLRNRGYEYWPPKPHSLGTKAFDLQLSYLTPSQIDHSIENSWFQSTDWKQTLFKFQKHEPVVFNCIDRWTRPHLHRFISGLKSPVVQCTFWLDCNRWVCRACHDPRMERSPPDLSALTVHWNYWNLPKTHQTCQAAPACGKLQKKQDWVHNTWPIVDMFCSYFLWNFASFSFASWII